MFRIHNLNIGKLSLYVLLCWLPHIKADDQIITTNPSTSSHVAGAKDISLSIEYATNSANTQTTGIGISIYFDSSKLEFVSLTENGAVEDDLFVITAAPSDIATDDDNDDDNSATDKKANINLISFSGNFPDEDVWPADEAPLSLGTIVFRAAETGIIGTTTINYELNTALGYNGVAESATIEFLADSDGDGVFDTDDAFPLDATETIDTDTDGTGNNADTDDDNDGVLDTADAFALISLDGLTDTDGDGRPNDCDSTCQTAGMSADTDDDNDGVLDTADAFALISLDGLTDTDGDGRPNDCDSSCQTAGMSADTDDDNDEALDADDAFPLDATESVDTDNDGTGNNADTDDDNDEVLDADDAFPLDAAESIDTDSDGTGNNADADDDNDGVLDTDDAFPLDATESIDTDTDGTGNNADTDDDNDGVSDGADLFPLDASESSDADSDGIGNNADEDDDNDLVLDSDDAFPEDARYAEDLDGDSLPDEWEQQYGLDIDDPKNAYFDPDQDGYLNWEEFLSGSDPAVAERKAQVIYTDRVAILTPARTSRFTVSYTTTDLNPNLTGVGIRIHYNSAYVTEVVLENIFDPGLLGVDQVQNDEFDLDGDADTDRYFIVAWADTNDPTWPGQLPTDLFDIVITTVDTIIELDFYPIRFSVAGTAVGYNLSAPSVYNLVASTSLDIDGDGEANALSDGLMVIRRFFGFTGESLISGAVSDEATYKTAETIAERIDAFSDGFDVDADGQVEALSDGLMIIRRLFGFSGESLVAGALSASAERTDPDEIAAFIDSLANIKD